MDRSVKTERRLIEHRNKNGQPEYPFSEFACETHTAVGEQNHMLDIYHDEEKFKKWAESMARGRIYTLDIVGDENVIKMVCNIYETEEDKQLHLEHEFEDVPVEDEINSNKICQRKQQENSLSQKI